MEASPKPPPRRHNQRLALHYHPIESVQTNPRDPRKYARAERRRVTKAVGHNGPMVLVVDRDMVMLSGNIWLEAARDAGYTEVPVIIADHLSPPEAEAYMLANVRLVERGQWDQQKLGEILRDLTLREIDFDLDVTGFDPPEIDALILDLDSGPSDAGKDDLIPAARTGRQPPGRSMAPRRPSSGL